MRPENLKNVALRLALCLRELRDASVALIAVAFSVALLIGALPAGAQQAAGQDDADVQVSGQVVSPDLPLDELAIRLTPLTKKELAAAVAAWISHARSATEDVAEAQIAVLRASGDSQQAARSALAAEKAERNRIFDKLGLVVDAYAAKGGAAEKVAEFHAYRDAVLSDETRQADWRTHFETFQGWLFASDGGIGIVIRIGVLIVALITLLAVARIIRRSVGTRIGRVPNISKLLQGFILVVIYWLTIAVGLMLVLAGLGVDVTPLFAVLGGASFILAFALQDTLSNLAAGLMIMITRPFDEGDYVELGAISGSVRKVSITRTTLVTPDNQVIQIPNSTVWGDIITNVNASDTRRVDLAFGVSYDDDLRAVERALRETVTAHPLVLQTPEPTIKLNALSDSSVDFICRPWARTEDYWTVYWDLMAQIKLRFDRDGITIPYPQQDVRLHGSGPSGAMTTEQAPRN